MIKADSTPILYIIVSIVLLIISAVGKNKKKIQQQPKTHTDSTEPENHQPAPKPNWQKELEDIFGNVFEERPDKAPEKTWQEEHRRPDIIVDETSWKSEYQKPETEITQQQSLQTIEDKTKLQYQHTEIEDIIDKEEKGRVELEEFELEKAIIYSEVINRKYF